MKRRIKIISLILPATLMLLLCSCNNINKPKAASNLKNADYWVDKLKLEKHPEGGYYRQIYHSSEKIPLKGLPKRFTEPHFFCTSIYFLLKGNNISAFHRIKQDEIWHFYEGVPVLIHIISPEGNYHVEKLGNNYENGESFQVVVKEGSYFGANLKNSNSFALVGCTVAPGFEFVDFELPSRAELLKKYPEYDDIIKKLTHE